MYEKSTVKKLRVVQVVVILVFTLAAMAVQARQRPDVQKLVDGFQRIELDSGYTFEWKIDGDEMEATISAPTTGWVAIGFNPTNRMQGATFVIGYVQNGNVNMRHDWGHAPTSHRAVTSVGGTNRVTSLGGREQDGRTELSFRLPLDPGDRFFSALKAGEDNTVIWSFGRNGDKNYSARHVERGAFVAGF